MGERLRKARPAAGVFVSFPLAIGLLLGWKPNEQESRPAPTDFSHKNHVPEVWAEAREEERDCRGCHFFPKDGGPSTPFAHCGDCHAGQGKLEPSFDKDFRWCRTRTSAAFRHTEHLALACRECHQPDSGSVPAHFAIQTGAEVCKRCHGPEAREEVVAGFERVRGKELSLSTPAKLQEAIGARLNDGRLGPLDEQQVFDHGDHFRKNSLNSWSETDCLSCHGEIREALRAQFGLKQQFDTCGKCHIAAQDRPLGFRPRHEQTRSQWTLGTFAHADHYANLNDKDERRPDLCLNPGYDRIEAESCRACHLYGPRVMDDTRRDYPFGNYANCAACHAGTSVATLDGLHGGDWKTCTPCHTFAAGDMNCDRPRTAVQRRRGKFSFSEHAHPHVTLVGNQLLRVQGIAPLDDCKKCHVGKDERLSSRLGARQFRHDTHLPQDCTVCHPGTPSASGSASLAPASEDGVQRTYSLVRCAPCHADKPVIEVADEKDTLVRSELVVEFSHKTHMQSERWPLTCTQCHSVDAASGSITTPKEALRCTQCHGHEQEGERSARTGGVFGKDVQSCVLCHQTGVPRLGTKKTDAHVETFAGFDTGQHHPQLKEKACDVCHWHEGAILATPQSNITANHQASVHEGQGNVPKPDKCTACHWHQPRGDWKWAAYEKPEVESMPWSESTRAALGNVLKDYPGVQ